MKTDYRKIDIYIKNKDNYWVYECSTTWSKTCKLAKQNFMSKHYYSDNTQVKANYSASI